MSPKNRRASFACRMGSFPDFVQAKSRNLVMLHCNIKKSFAICPFVEPIARPKIAKSHMIFRIRITSPVAAPAFLARSQTF